MSLLRVVPVTLTDARIYVQRWHSHLDAPVGGLFAAAVEHVERGVVCVAVMGRPVARLLDQRDAGGGRSVAELTRVASDGTAPHAASMAGAAVSRAALVLGYRRLVSKTLLGEAGTMYRAMGWRAVAVRNRPRDETWEREGRVREHPAQPGAKVRWEYGPDALPYDAVVDAFVREHVGKVALLPRPERLPLLALGMDRGDGT
jgi:hypothetical protein